MSSGQLATDRIQLNNRSMRRFRRRPCMYQPCKQCNCHRPDQYNQYCTCKLKYHRYLAQMCGWQGRACRIRRRWHWRYKIQIHTRSLKGVENRRAMLRLLGNLCKQMNHSDFGMFPLHTGYMVGAHLVHRIQHCTSNSLNVRSPQGNQNEVGTECTSNLRLQQLGRNICPVRIEYTQLNH